MPGGLWTSIDGPERYDAGGECVRSGRASTSSVTSSGEDALTLDDFRSQFCGPPFGELQGQSDLDRTIAGQSVCSHPRHPGSLRFRATQGTPDLVVESLEASPRTLTVGRDLHPVGQCAQRRRRGCRRDDVALLLLSVEQRGVGGRGVGPRGRPSGLDEPLRVDPLGGAVARGARTTTMRAWSPSPASGIRTTAPAACG